MFLPVDLAGKSGKSYRHIEFPTLTRREMGRFSTSFYFFEIKILTL